MTDLRARLIETMADAMFELPFDTLELRNWGEESVPDAARVLAVAALDAALDTLTENAEEWEEASWSQAALIDVHGDITNEDRVAAIRPPEGET